MNVREVMTSGNLLTVLESDTLAAAAHKMAWGTCRHLPVVRDGQVIGILSERDVLAWLGEGHRLDGPSDLVRAAMVAPAVLAMPEDDIGEAAARMISRRISCLPVVAHGNLVGIITGSDLLDRIVADMYTPT
jgi:acetoin utilization protein AcuB